MFGARYSRAQFWVFSLITIVVCTFLMVLAADAGGEGAEALVSLAMLVPLIHVLANRIRAFGSNPWLALLAVLPFVGLFQAFYFGIKQSKTGVEERLD